MKAIVYILSFISLIFMGNWAYREGYATRDALQEADMLQQDIGELRAELSVTRAEWAYLNRPQRLSDLAMANFATLGLVPMEPRQLGTVAQLSFPQPLMDGLFALEGVTDAAGLLATPQDQSGQGGAP